MASLADDVKRAVFRPFYWALWILAAAWVIAAFVRADKENGLLAFAVSFFVQVVTVFIDIFKMLWAQLPIDGV